MPSLHSATSSTSWPLAPDGICAIFSSVISSSAVAARDQHTETDGDRFVLRAPAAPRDRRDLTPEAVVGLAPFVVYGQSCDPPLKWHSGQPGPCRDHAPGEHDRAWAGHPVREQRP